MLNPLYQMVDRNRAGDPASLVCVCSAHHDVLRAALNWAERCDLPLIIETTSNQVNQDGGYTGQTPAMFADHLRAQAKAQGVAWDRLILGGDHLGPQAWKNLSAEAAMAKAVTMVESYVAAGFKKIHLDCSQACADEATPLSDTVVAHRSARLADACERANQGELPAYVIGTEVPTPGGSTDQGETITPTTPHAALATLKAHEETSLEHLKDRIVGLVVQPGVEFLPMSIHALPKDTDTQLREVMMTWPRLVLEAHSTDYQSPNAFHRLAALGFGFQKVGPALTFAVRQALYSLDQALSYLGRGVGLFDTMESLMQHDDRHWRQHYEADDQVARHFGLSDRIRYYWNTQRAQQSVMALRTRVQEATLPDPLLRQAFGADVLARAECLSGPQDQRLIDASIELALEPYDLKKYNSKKHNLKTYDLKKGEYSS